MFYKPNGKAVCADVIPYYENGQFVLFYLKDYRDTDNYGEGCDWNLLTTSDLVHFVDHGTVLQRGTEEEQDLYVFTGCCYKHCGKYYIFYTGHNPHKRERGLAEQKILLATSDDLLHWHKERDFCLCAPRNSEIHDFRDPFVYYDDARGQFAMLVAAREQNDAPANFKGVTLVAYSDDLLHWKFSDKPFYSPRAYFALECPDLFQMGDWWYLVFSEFTDRYITTYRMSKSPDGPWIAPKVNTFDGHAFYAAKSVSDGNRRIMFGWNPIKCDERDDGIWQWGGSIVAHQLVQAEDGTLYVKCPNEICEAYSRQKDFALTEQMGSVFQTNDGYEIGDSCGRSFVLFEAMPESCKIRFDFTASDDVGDFGLLLNCNFADNTFYTLRFEPMYNRASLDRWPRSDIAKHTSTDTERYFPITAGAENSVTVIIDGSVIEVYINDKIAMGGRMFDFKGKWGLYTMNTKVKFSDIRLYEEVKRES